MLSGYNFSLVFLARAIAKKSSGSIHGIHYTHWCSAVGRWMVGCLESDGCVLRWRREPSLLLGSSSHAGEHTGKLACIHSIVLAPCFENTNTE
jgi:hypothetical protein